ncbi:hypothetical protein CRG98_029788 [Punica granatum]|uniref:G-patch domain-containing protein n=1 Tax=Punica granatum TaxID=22663 RepID=A0A2I0J0N6_PUNGR|nr:hypothetical protein CRG98_029788 [Punica granatum]
MLRGAYYSHLLAHTSSFSDLIEAGKKLDMDVKLGRIDGKSRKKDGEASKKQTVGTSRKGNKIRTEVPSPNFDPIVHNQNLRCEFHQGAPSHTLDNCWRLGNKIQEMINAKQISFNDVKPLNVQANPLPNHGSSSGPSINMISTAAIGEEDDVQEIPVPFVIDYAPAEIAVAYASFFIKCPEPANKGKAPAPAFSAIPEAVLFPVKKVTEQEAEVFMKVIKASEYKVVEQMGKSPAHISLLALLLSSKPHRDALLKVLTAAQVLKDIVPDRIEETVNFIFLNQISFVDDELPYEDDRMIRKLLLKNEYVPGTGLGARAQGILRPIEVEEYRNRRGLGFHPSYHEIVQARRGKHLQRLAAHYGKLSRGISVPPLSQFFPALPQVVGGTSDSPSTESNDSSLDVVEVFLALPTTYAVTEETSFGVHIRPAREDEELTNRTAVPLY